MNGDIKITIRRTIDWKQGLAIALGVPLLILPSIGYFATYMWSFSIIIWLISIFQGFMQNIAYGEMAAMFPSASGLPGFAQEVFRGNKIYGFDAGKLLGGFSAWSYWFSWNAVLAIFSILIANYLHALIPTLDRLDTTLLSLVCGIAIFSGLLVVNARGLYRSAKLGYILTVISLVPMFVIAVIPLLNGSFHWENIASSWLPSGWQWNGTGFLTLFGLLAMAQWSACAWETAAMYGPEYKNPGTDIPKALFFCGAICVVTFTVIQTVCIGTLGVQSVIEEPYSPMLLLARKSFGELGTSISILMLAAAMILIIQTAFLGSARAMRSMAQEGNLPECFGKTNQYGTPMNAMFFTAVFNIILIMLKTPSAILAASAMGYVVTNGIGLLAYYQIKTQPQFNMVPRLFKGPKGWGAVGLFFGILNIPIYLLGIIYVNSLDLGWGSTIVGFSVLAVYIPVWFYTRKCIETSIMKVNSFSEQ